MNVDKSSPAYRSCLAIGRDAGQLVALSLLAAPFVLFLRWLITRHG